VRCRLGFHRHPFLHLDAAFRMSRIAGVLGEPFVSPTSDLPL
jgi:hypothetical protein